MRLQDLYESNEDIKQVVDLIKSNQLPGKEMSIDRAAHLLASKNKLAFSTAYKKTKKAMRTLEENSLGTYIEGRRGHGSRFKADRALDEVITFEEVPGAYKPRQQTPSPRLTERKEQFHLRHDFTVVLTLPQDLTRDEAKRLSIWVGILAYGGST